MQYVIAMRESQLERKLAKRPDEFRSETKNKYLLYLATLYDHHLGRFVLSEIMQDIYNRELKALSLPQKISIFYDLKESGRKCIGRGDTSNGSYS